MAIAASDILFRHSVVAAAGNTTVGTPAGSLGDQVSTTDVPTTKNGIFDDVSGTENANSVAEYRCIFVLNNHATLTAQAVTLYVAADIAGGAVVAVGLDPTAKSAKGSASAQAVTIANETTAPAGVTFTAPTTDGTGLAIGDLAPGEVKAVWIRRTAANTSAITADGFTIGTAFDTAA